MKIVDFNIDQRVRQGKEIEYGKFYFILEINNHYFHFSTDYKCWLHEGLYHVYAVYIGCYDVLEGCTTYKRLRGNINHNLRLLVEKFMEGRF